MPQENEENKIANETNYRPPEENAPIAESLAHAKKEENEEAKETSQFSEENNSHHPSEDKKSFNQKKASNVSKGVSASITSAALVLVVASVVLIYQNFNKADPTFTVDGLSLVNDDKEVGISYKVSTTKNDDKIPLVFEAIYLDDYSRAIDTVKIDITGVDTYTGLLSLENYYDSNYLVKVIRTDHNSEKVLWTSSSKFSRPKMSKFYSFFWECHCVDPVSVAGEAAGKAYYQLHYIDDFNKWNNLSVTLTNKDDASISYDFACEKPYKEKHLVETLSKHGGEYSAAIKADVTQDDSSVKNETIFTTSVKI